MHYYLGGMQKPNATPGSNSKLARNFTTLHVHNYLGGMQKPNATPDSNSKLARNFTTLHMQLFRWNAKTQRNPWLKQ